MAHLLSSKGVPSGGRVGICLDRSAELVVGLLGILKAGAAYVPLDPSYPGQRLAFMLQDAAVLVLLTQRSLLDRMGELKAKRIGSSVRIKRSALEAYLAD